MRNTQIDKLILALSVTVASLFALPAPAAAQATPGMCHDGVLPSGALSRICVPETGWNGDLVVFAHGYVAETGEPLAFHHLQLPDGTDIPVLVQSLGFAFATTSYRQNGLAILEGVQDIAELAASFEGATGHAAGRTILAGVSEGGIVTALALERRPDLFWGGLSTCGPIGTFGGQIDYIGDFRALFDFYYPGVIPGTAIDVPSIVREHWDDIWVPVIASLITADPGRALELVRVAGAPIDPADPSTIVSTTLGVLWYNVFGANDAAQKLGGNPYDNLSRWYTGSGNDFLLNVLVNRYAADVGARTALSAYETSAALTVPMVTLHTIGDQIIPFGHEIWYAFKNAINPPTGRGRFIPIPIARYGHCQFNAGEVVTSFVILLTQP